MSTKKNKTGDIHQQAPLLFQQLESMYIKAQGLQQQGYLSEAEEIYKSILKKAPEQPDALHYLGLIYMNKGDNKQAENYIRKSIQYSGNPIYYSNYGLLLSRQMRHEQAVEHFRKAAALRPDYAEAWYNLGFSYTELGDLAAAEESYNKAISCRQNYVKAMFGLLRVQEVLNKKKEADDTIKKLISITPDSASMYYNLGIILQYAGGQDNIRKAYEYLSKANELEPNSLEIHYALAKLLDEANNTEAAMDIYRKILEIEPEYQDIKLSYAQCLLKNEQIGEAENEIRSILAQTPDSIPTQAVLGNIYRIRGEFSKAESIFRKILEVDKYNNNALAGLAGCRKFDNGNDPFIKQLVDAVEKKKTYIGCFALGKIYNDLGKYDLAFDFYKKANEMKNSRIDYNPADHSNYIESIINIFTRELISDLQKYGSDSEAPVFIIGTPRSGTTLTEQIISSHSAVYGAGELKFISELAANTYRTQNTDKKYPERIQILTPDEIHKEADIYLDKTFHYLTNGISRVTDKMPLNFLHLGYISILFPKAKIIHCRRNPLDACISIYFQAFSSEHQYSFDLANLAYWYRDYIKIMQHWNVILGNKILNVDYDNTVNAVENVARKLIDFCGLDWEPGCIEFHKTRREVQTASLWQVRQPVYKTSLARWKRYDKHIGILKEILTGYY
jgi:tetratricopeptide (TPR) repeat protein